MKFLIGFSVDMPDNVAHQLIRTAGPSLPLDDYPLALALAVITPFPAQIRSLLLTPGHEPVPFNSDTLLTTPKSATQVQFLIATADGEELPPWFNKPLPKKSSKKPSKRAKKKPSAASASPSKSKSAKRIWPRSTEG